MRFGPKGSPTGIDISGNLPGLRVLGEGPLASSELLQSLQSQSGPHTISANPHSSVLRERLISFPGERSGVQIGKRPAHAGQLGRGTARIDRHQT